MIIQFKGLYSKDYYNYHVKVLQKKTMPNTDVELLSGTILHDTFLLIIYCSLDNLPFIDHHHGGQGHVAANCLSVHLLQQLFILLLHLGNIQDLE